MGGAEKRSDGRYHEVQAPKQLTTFLFCIVILNLLLCLFTPSTGFMRPPLSIRKTFFFLAQSIPPKYGYKVRIQQTVPSNPVATKKCSREDIEGMFLEVESEEEESEEEESEEEE